VLCPARSGPQLLGILETAFGPQVLPEHDLEVAPVEILLEVEDVHLEHQAVPRALEGRPRAEIRDGRERDAVDDRFDRVDAGGGSTASCGTTFAVGKPSVRPRGPPRTTVPTPREAAEDCGARVPESPRAIASRIAVDDTGWPSTSNGVARAHLETELVPSSRNCCGVPVRSLPSAES
jgi:hypothetical protein